MAAVIFNQAGFLQDFPEFALTVGATPGSAAACFKQACNILDNTDSSKVPDPPRTDLLNLLVAHLMVMRFGVNGKPPSGAVGRVKSAGEGSVHAEFEMGPATQSTAWYNQTTYGAAYYQQTRSYRTALHVPAPYIPNPYFIPGD